MNTQTLLIAILVVVVFGVGFMIGRMTAVPSYEVSSSTEQTASDNVNEEGGGENISEGEGGTAVSAEDLTPGQRKLLESLGINADEIVITQEMVLCAEARLGADRIEEIKDGATPSFLEGVELVTCYK